MPRRAATGHGLPRAGAALQHIIELISHFGLQFVFFNLLIEQTGAPVPAYPVLIVTAALAMGPCAIC